MALTYFLSDFEMVPVASIATGITLVFTFHYYYYYYYYHHHHHHHHRHHQLQLCSSMLVEMYVYWKNQRLLWNVLRADWIRLGHNSWPFVFFCNIIWQHFCLNVHSALKFASFYFRPLGLFV
jgi:hypothetical protein